ncbi:MAG: hypothetical protein J0I12_25875 [Candidatus Eremiobacteraeota bacterium]|nr:hypothetical protein [Candidatus Eremiobacteraeota bacterium]
MEHRVERRTGEVLNFATSSESYTVYIDPDLRLDVARVQTKPADGNQDIYMWIQAVQGFFVLHQDLSLGRSSPWRLIFEVMPESFSSSFFPWVDDEFFRLLQEWQKVESPPLDNNQTGD